MKVILRDTKQIIDVKDEIFKYKFNNHLVHQVVMSYISNNHRGTKSQKSRSEVSGSNRKPWRQKGTGRARAGSKKSPIWRSGGVTFAAKPEKYKHKINKRMYNIAIRSILSELTRNNNLIFIHSILINKPKTKILVEKLNDINIKNALIVVNKNERNLVLASRNLKRIRVCHFNFINPVLLISFEKVIITLDTIYKIEDILL